MATVVCSRIFGPVFLFLKTVFKDIENIILINAVSTGYFYSDSFSFILFLSALSLYCFLGSLIIVVCFRIKRLLLLFV